jgi:hypothetical protein
LLYEVLPMILGTSGPGAAGVPTQQNPIDFTPPSVGGGNVFSLPSPRFFSRNIQPFPAVMPPMRSYPAYHPRNPALGPQPLPQIAPPTPPATAMAPAAGPTPAGTNGSFGGSGFGSSGGVRAHSHVDPYRVMRSGMIPGVSANGSNIRAGYMNAGDRVDASMPFQSFPLTQAAPAPMPMPMPMAPAPTAAGVHGFGSFSWNPMHWFSRSPRPQMRTVQMPNGDLRMMAHPAAMAPSQGDMQANAKAQHAALRAMSPNCETVGPRLDGMLLTICNGTVVGISDADGNFRRVGQNA